MDNPIEPACAGNGLVDSVTNDELPFPTGYDPMCTGCRLLCGMYGPEDGELIAHISGDHIDPDFDTRNFGDNVTSIGNILIDIGFITTLDPETHHNSPAN